MPIKPENRALYPPTAEWRAIRTEILARAAGRCECLDECGSGHIGGECKIINREWVCRSLDAPPRWIYVPKPGTRGATLVIPPGFNTEPIQVVLTVAHLDHNPQNNHRRNLRAMCQLCHLRLDRDRHAENAAKTRAKRKSAAQAPQFELFEEATP